MTCETRLGNKSIQSRRPARFLQKVFLWVLLASLSVMAFVLAPAKNIFVLNHVQKQCAWFWPGDEYVYYAPPEPWQEAKPDSNGLIQTRFGSCSFEEVNNYKISAEACCQKLGYTFIGEIKGIVEKRDYGLTIGLIIQVLIILIYRYWVLIAIFLVVAYSLRKWFKKNANKPETSGERDVS